MAFGIGTGFSPGDVNIYTAQLSGDAGSIDISPMIRHFSTFENLRKPYVALQLQIVDVADIANYNLGINGSNTLDLSFGQPGQDPYTKTFSIVSAERSHRNEQLRVQEFELVGYSPQMTAFPKVQKSYKNMPLTDVARDLIQTYLPGLQVPLQINAPSRGQCGNDKMPFTVSGTQIHKAIRQTLLRAASSTDTSSAYVFFENNKALIIDTIANLLATQLGSAGVYRTFYQKPMGASFLQDHRDQNFIIQALVEESRVDKTAVVQAENVQSRPFDIFSNLLTKDNPFGGGQGAGGGASTYMNIPYNIMRPPTYLQEVLPQRKRAAAAVDQQSATFTVALNPYVTVGEAVNLQTLAPGGDTETPVLDKLAGESLAIEVRHSVDLTKKRMQGTTICKAIKGDLSIF